MRIETWSRLAAGVVGLTAATAQAQLAVSAMRETQKVRPSDPAPAEQSSISLSCAQNEFCAFQVVASAADAGVTVSDLSLSDLSGPGAALSGSAALVYREGFLDIATPSNTAGAMGLWPDPLIPKVDDFYGETRNAFPIDVTAGQNQPFWVELHIPTGQAPGTYSGTATVTAADTSTATVTVSVQVRGFALPSTASLGSAYGFDWDGPCVGHFGGYGPPNCDDQQLEALNALYFQDALNHRLSISGLVYAPPIADGGGDWSTFDSLYGPFLSGTALTGSDQLQGAQLTQLAFSSDDHAPATYANWASHFQANGWYSALFDYTCDEPPNGCNWSDIPTRAAAVHAGAADFRTLVTTSIGEATQNNVLSSINILVPIINYLFDESSGTSTRASYDTFLAQPNSAVWMYQSCEPSSSCSDGSVGTDIGYPTMFIDESAVTNRMMQWMDFEYQVSTELYYDTTYAMSQASNDAWTSQYEFGNNGDGSIWYPGSPSVIGGTHDIPIESFRMKMLREGMQDYEYLHLLTQLGDGAFAQSQLGVVVSAANSFAADPSVLEEARLAMAAEIETDLAAMTATSSSGGSSGSTTGPGSTGSTGGSTATAASSSTSAGGTSGASSTTGSTAASSSGGHSSSSNGGVGSTGRASSSVASTSSGMGSTGASSRGTSSSGSVASSSTTGSSSTTKASDGCGCASGASPAGALPWLLLPLGAARRRRSSALHDRRQLN